MVFTDFGFSVIRNWMVGGELATAPSGMLSGTSSGAPAFTDTLLGSPLYPTWHAFDSRSGLTFTAEYEHTVLSGDITTGSIVREIGMAATSGGKLFVRNLAPEVVLFGSTIILSNLTVTVN